jgi:energy-coupling factor transporter ATP-binding protein EcfA2
VARDALTDAPVPPGENSPPLLELVGVSAAPPGSRAPVLTDVDLRLAGGTCGVLLGGNGAGKSTLLRTAAGLWPPRAGTVRSPSETAFDPRQVALVLEDPAAQFLAATVSEELEFALENQGLRREEILARRDATLAAFNLEPLRHRDPATLSPGEQSRCLIAAALVLEPRVLLLDDTFLYLGPGEGRALWNALCREIRRDRSRAVLLATHDGDLAVEVDRVGILAEGRLRAWGPPATVLRQELPASVEPPLDLWMEDALRRTGVVLPAGDLGVEGLAGRLASGGEP